MSDTRRQAKLFAQMLLKQKAMFACAESCTGGLLSKYCTDLEGSSRWFERGYITYSNEAKREMLGVEAKLLELHGAVSEQVARNMVDGVVQNSHANIAVAVTGIAGPGGGSIEKPVGTVFFGFAVFDRRITERMQFNGDREAVREQSVAHVFTRLNAELQ